MFAGFNLRKKREFRIILIVIFPYLPPMSDLTKYMQNNNRIFVLIFSVLVALLLIYLSLYISFLIYLVPVGVFIVMHYLKMWRLVPRILGATVVFFVAVVLASVIFGYALFDSSGVTGQSLANGSNVIASVEPFNHEASTYNFTFSISGNQTLYTYYMNIKGISNGYYANISQAQLSTSHNATGALMISYVATNITPTGVYEYYLYFDNGTSVISNVGPVFSAGAIIELYLLDLTPGFMITFELIFVVGAFIARSISNSASMRKRYLNPPPPPQPDQVSEPDNQDLPK